MAHSPPNTNASDGPVLEIGARVAGTYEVVRFLHAGGMGQVYEARNVWTQRRVALKVLSTESMGKPQAQRRFIREAQLSARLTHPNIVRVLDMGIAPEGFLFLVNELVDGESLETCLLRRGKLPVGAAVKLMLPILDALIMAHEQGIVHRDVKPGNILLAQKARDYIVPQLTDFGLAKPIQPAAESKITEAGQRLGTPRYMSPEQLRDAPDIDGRSDIWSVGVTLYEILTGRVPFEGQSVPEQVVSILRAPILAPSTYSKKVPPELDAVVLKALSRKRSDRYQTMRAMHRDLTLVAERLLQQRDREAATSSVAPPHAEPEYGSGPDSMHDRTRDTPRVLRALSLARPLRAGIVATSQAESYRDLDVAFTQALGFRCDVLRYFNYAELVGALVEREVEIAWLPPVAYVRAAQARAAKLLVTVERAGQAEFTAAILGRRGAADSWDDLRGRRAVWVDPWSTAGYLVPRWMMRSRGLSPDEDFASQGFLGSHGAVIEALRAGTADVGATFCAVDPQGNIIERPWRDHDPFTVIGLSAPIPGDTICAAHDLTDELTQLITKSLVSLPPNAPLPQMLGASQLVKTDPSRYDTFAVAIQAEADETRRVVQH